MQRKKGYRLTPKYFYFNIKTGYNTTTLISRKTEEEARYAFNNYVSQNKECEWLGEYDGKNFIKEDSVETA